MPLAAAIDPTAPSSSWRASLSTFRTPANVLAASPDGLSFTEMRETLEMTDGNLTAHLRTLHEAGHVAFTKSLEGARPLTTYALTAKGRKGFSEYIDQLEQIVRLTKGK